MLAPEIEVQARDLAQSRGDFQRPHGNLVCTVVAVGTLSAASFSSNSLPRVNHKA